jgi:hypothetical protein
MGAQFEESLSKVSCFKCVVDPWAVGMLREEFGEEAVEVHSKEHGGRNRGSLSGTLDAPVSRGSLRISMFSFLSLCWDLAISL